MSFGFIELSIVLAVAMVAAFIWLRMRRGRDLREFLNEPKKIKIHGIIFGIRKISPLNFMEGAQVVQSIFQSYEQKKDINPANSKKIKDHYIDMFMSAVVSPTLVRKQEEAVNGAVWVEGLINDWGLATELYEKIVDYSYGKKKF